MGTVYLRVMIDIERPTELCSSAFRLQGEVTSTKGAASWDGWAISLTSHSGEKGVFYLLPAQRLDEVG
jgi:hypothetical protein